MIENLENTICDLFEIQKQTLCEKNHLKRESLARGYLWYILHYDYKLSNKKIAMHYERNIRTVQKMIAKMKYLIDNLKSYKSEYDKIRSFMI